MRRAIVIGGSGAGIGSAIAQRLRKEGCAVATLQRRTDHSNPTGTPDLDLRWSPMVIQGHVARAVEALGGLDWLVVAGGVARAGKPVKGDPLSFYLASRHVEEQWRTNYLGCRFAIEAALRHMTGRPPRHMTRVLVIGSTVTRSPPVWLADYAASKAALETWLRAVAPLYARHGVLLNVLAPGWTRGPMTDVIHEDMKARILRRIPLGRMLEPDEVADAAWLHLIGPAYHVGDVIPLSGGL